MEYFDDALFIGDSRTVGIKLYGTLKNADYFCDKGLMVSRIDDSTVDNMTAWDKLRKKQYAKIYVMLGVNEIGNDIEGTTAKYRRFLDGIKEAQPNAIIYLQANLHVASYKEDSVINNERINTLNDNLQAMADNSRVYYIDVNPIFDDENGALQADITSDGLHVLAMYYSDWCDWLCQNTVAVSPTASTATTENSIPSENTTAADDTTTSNKKPQNEEFSNL
jgi:lysophospholipase L1-like esterase